MVNFHCYVSSPEGIHELRHGNKPFAQTVAGGPLPGPVIGFFRHSDRGPRFTLVLFLKCDGSCYICKVCTVMYCNVL